MVMYYKVKYVDGTENDFEKECETINLEEKDFVIFYKKVDGLDIFGYPCVNGEVVSYVRKDLIKEIVRVEE